MEINSLSLSSNSQNDNDALLFKHLPSHFLEMKDKGTQALKPLMQALFDNIDDALFELADRAEKNAVQNMYFESMREIRIKRRGMEEGFVRELMVNFRQLVDTPGTPPLLSDPLLQGKASEKADAVTVDSLSLVEDEELEELVAADSMVAKANRQYTNEIKQLTLYIDILISDMKITNKSNPLGPQSICQAFISVCRDLDLDIKAKLVLFKLFDRYVMGALGDVYKICNEVLFTAANVMELEPGSPSAKAGASTSVEPEVDLALGEPQEESGSDNVFLDLQRLLHKLPQQSSVNSLQTPSQRASQDPVAAAELVKNGLAEPGQATQIPKEQLLQLLQVVQQTSVEQLEQQQEKAFQGQVPDQPNIKHLLSHLLSDNMPSAPMSMGQLDDDAINLVAMLFRFILDDRNLAAPMKGLISQLQIPIIKIAMIDKTFFSKSGHPARKLLNEMAHASLGWSPSQNKDHDRDPLYNKVSEVVNRLVNCTDNNIDLFHDVLADFIAFVEIDSRRTKLVEQRTINAEDGKAKSEVARATVQKFLTEKIAGRSMPQVVDTLLQDAWSNVLFLSYLKQDSDSEYWQQTKQTVEDLIWSVQPIEGADSRQQLIKLIPDLLKRLRTGLTTIAYNPFDMNQLFMDLEVLHLAQLQSSNKVKVRPSITKIPQAKQIEETLDQLLEDHAKNGTSLEELDAELDAQLAEFNFNDDSGQRENSIDDAEVLSTEPPQLISARSNDDIEQSEAVITTATVHGPEDEPTTIEQSLETIAENNGSKIADKALVSESDEAVSSESGELIQDNVAKDNVAKDNVAKENVAKADISQDSVITDKIVPENTALDQNDPILAKVDALAMGNWVEVHQDDGKKFRCRLAAVIRSTGKYIFVNRSGMKVSEHSRMSLALEIKSGTVSLLDEGLLFDRALESVIGDLRNSKSRSA